MNGIDEDLQEHDELVDCGGVWMVGQVDVLVEQACDVGIPNGFMCREGLARRVSADVMQWINTSAEIHLKC